MDIGIIGAGNMGGGLGRLWTASGHRVWYSFSRHPEKLRLLASLAGPGGGAGTPAQAARFGSVVLLAVPWACVPEALAAAGPLTGKVLLDCTNPRGPFGELEVGLTTSGAEEVARLAPGARVVKALNAGPAQALRHPPPAASAERVTGFYCGDDGAAKAVAARLIAEAGFDPVDAGALQSARYLEPLAALLTRLAAAQGRPLGLRLAQA
jgi:predicted dinucleotide-binding enzyme